MEKEGEKRGSTKTPPLSSICYLSSKTLVNISNFNLYGNFVETFNIFNT